MKLFAMYALLIDGTRDLLWVKPLPADFDFEAWARSRAESAYILGVAKFYVEEVVL